MILLDEPIRLCLLYQVDLTGGMCFLLYTGGDSSKLDCVARSYIIPLSLSLSLSLN